MDKLFGANCKIFTLSHLAVISVTGEDGAKFLQGQLTCDINNLCESQAAIAAFCNPKGRVISTLLVVKTASEFLLVLPASLLDKVFDRLQRYILRSLVRLCSHSRNSQLFGLDCQPATKMELNLSAGDVGVGDDDFIFIKQPLSSSRYLCIAKQPQSATAAMLQNRFNVGDVEEWRYREISSGFPWFEEPQSELYIPQMLNIDRLGGISFNKGCYTGQEIIARTHYLGKAKRNLFLAECRDIAETPDCGLAILDSETRQTVGSILSAQTYSQNTRLLVILQVAEAEAKNLALDDAKQTAIKIEPIQ